MSLELVSFRKSTAERVGARPAFAYSDRKPSRVFPSRSTHEGKNEMANRQSDAGNFSGLNGGNLSAENAKPRAFHLTQREWRSLSSQAFRAHVGDRPGGAQALADEIECSPKTAQSWLDGESTPAGILDLRAMARIPAYAALKREIAAMETTMDPRLQAKYQELHRLTLEIAGGTPR